MTRCKINAAQLPLAARVQCERCGDSLHASQQTSPLPRLQTEAKGTIKCYQECLVASNIRHRRTDRPRSCRSTVSGVAGEGRLQPFHARRNSKRSALNRWLYFGSIGEP